MHESGKEQVSSDCFSLAIKSGVSNDFLKYWKLLIQLSVLDSPCMHTIHCPIHFIEHVVSHLRPETQILSGFGLNIYDSIIKVLIFDH
jgi:hypothetical protein